MIDTETIVFSVLCAVFSTIWVFIVHWMDRRKQERREEALFAELDQRMYEDYSRREGDQDVAADSDGVPR